VARDTPDEFDAWALRWLSRWLAETPAPTERAAEVSARHLLSEPLMFETLLAGLR
jgi:hypothetical protein